ncbi:MAG: hypothetical protein CXZ00_16580 [Acidobacteria bacterium]|nr:MAG: hypothetical protein CXZ00_16630 [Acidobacteriota bacterium]PSH02604.1 MAG: hypothetical protein CXZ00_16580 [Acidobacteriota bacterium]
MNCNLSRADCAEIYHALGLARARFVQLRIGENGERLTNPRMKLNTADAQVIYSALTSKRERILQGAYDSFPGEVERVGSFSFELLGHVKRILQEIGYMGENLTLEREIRQNSELGIEELRASLCV